MALRVGVKIEESSRFLEVAKTFVCSRKQKACVTGAQWSEGRLR